MAGIMRKAAYLGDGHGRRLLGVVFAACAAMTGMHAMAVEFEQGADTLVIREGGAALSVSLRAPMFLFASNPAPVGGIMPSAIEGDLDKAEGLRLLYPPQPVAAAITLDVVLRLTWNDSEKVLRKWAEFRLNSAAVDVVLREVTLDTLDAAGLAEPFAAGPPRSMPAFMNGFFAGVEFPIAATRVEGDKLIVGHRPLIGQPSGVWRVTRTAVYGVAGEEGARKAFHKYINAHRPAPTGLHFNYNSWWTSPVPFTESDILALMSTFEENLFKAHGVAFDTFTIDLGWSNPATIWAIDDKLFPEGFTRIQKGAEQMGSHLGLWTSPSAFYVQALNPDLIKDPGYEALEIPWGPGKARIQSLGNSKYAGAYRDQIAGMAGRYDIRQVKLDGLYQGAGDMAGSYSAEQTAEGAIAAFEAIRAANPNVWLECTFDANASPWWLFYTNSVIGMLGDDSPYGRVPCPVYRESYTTARDYYNLLGADRLMAPIPAQEVLGILHQSSDPFLNDAVVAIMRGHAFLPMYVNPKYMNAPRWEQLANALRWARENEHMLTGADIQVLRPVAWQSVDIPTFTHDAVMPREPYGYAHWEGAKGLVMLRNPWIVPQSYALPLPAGVVVNAASLYPEPRIYGQGVQGASMEIKLAPYETLVLAISPDQPVNGIPNRDECVSGQVELSGAGAKVEKVEYDMSGGKFGPDWTSLAPETGGAIEVRLNAKVTVNAPRARIFLLAEGAAKEPGVKGVLHVDDATALMRQNPSSAGFAASSGPASEFWAFLEGDIPPGEHDIKVDAMVDGGCTQLSAWVWAMRDGEAGIPYPNRLPSPEQVSLDSRALLEPTDIATLPSAAAKKTAPLERIEGLFLDTLEPVSQVQGWGTLQRNQSVWEKPMTIAGIRYQRGLGTHAPARIVYALDDAYARFEAWAGPDGANNGTVTFEVLVDGVKRWESGFMTKADAPRQVSVDITGARQLELIVGDGGNGNTSDHANWADAKLIK